MGTIYFYGKNNAEGSSFYSISDQPGQSINLKSMSGKNDVARSLRLENARTGVVIKVYDSPSADTSDDWSEIEVLKQVPTCVVGTFERNYTDPDGVYRQVFHRYNGLDGKVSYVKTDAAPPLQLDYVALGRLFAADGWNDKGGLACQFDSQDSWYRLYQPEATSMIVNGAIVGTRITGQLDHVRSGQTDDHCYFTIEIENRDDGEVTTKMDFKWGNDPLIPGKVRVAGKVAGEVVKAIIDLPSFPVLSGVSKIMDYFMECFKRFLEAARDNGGRINFNSVVNHTLNRILQSTRATSP